MNKLDNFYIEYRDPLFSIIILFSIIFIIAFVNYFWSIFKSNEEKQSIERFIKRFEVAKEKDAYKELLDSFKLSTESLALLAHSYVKSGDFESAIGIYLIALKQVKGKTKKQYILSELGKAYFKAGFLQRSAEVFLESLRLYPRNKDALKYLTVCYESLKTYDLALEALNALEELEVNVTKEKAYLKALLTIENKKLTDNEKIQDLKTLREDFPQVDRIIIEYKHAKAILENEDLDIQNPQMIFDLIWFFEDDEIDYEKLTHPFYQSIGAVKGVEGLMERSRIFELEILDNLRQNKYNKASLNFEFTCKQCKNTFPVFFYRCPNCHELSSVDIQPILINKNYETYLPFQ